MLDEFNKIKEKLINYILDFEILQRKANLLNTSYLLEFHKEIEEEHKLKYENDGLIQAISFAAKGKSENEIKALLEQIRKSYVDYQRHYYQQYNQAKNLEKLCSKYTKEDMEVLDDSFKKYCENYHPLIHIHASEAEKNLYPLLISIFRMGNLQGFKSFLKENEGIFTQEDIEEKGYEFYIAEYQKSILDLQKLIINLKQAFPLNKEDMFYKEELLTREQMDLRENIYNLRDMNKALHKDFLLQFSFDFKL